MYVPADSGSWQGRTDHEDGTGGYRWHQAVQLQPPAQAGVALLGLASDRGVVQNKGRPGAAEGPAALRRALAGLAWHHSLALYDAGDIRVEADLEAGQSAYAEQLAALLAAGHFVVGLGGGHEIGWASYQGCQQYLQQASPGSRLGILNFDAHLDLRKPAPLASSGTPFYQAAQHCTNSGQPFRYLCLGISKLANTRALFARADSLGADYLLDRDCNAEQVQLKLERLLETIDVLYLTCCLDVFPASMAPGVSAPAALGVNPATVLQMLAAVQRLCERHNVRLLCADVAELLPAHDPDGRTAKLAALLVEELVNMGEAQRA